MGHSLDELIDPSARMRRTIVDGALHRREPAAVKPIQFERRGPGFIFAQYGSPDDAHLIPVKDLSFNYDPKAFVGFFKDRANKLTQIVACSEVSHGTFVLYLGNT